MSFPARPSALALSLVIAALFLIPGASATIRYSVSFDHPEEHLFLVEMQIPDVAGGVTVQLPAWNALYQIRDFSSHVRQVSASADGRDLGIDKVDKETWRIGGSGAITVRYSVYWDEAGPFAAQLNAEHAFVNLAMVLFYVPERRGEDVGLSLLRLPEGWRVASALSPQASTSGDAHGAEFAASSYDALVDAPIEAGRFQEFTLRGISPAIRVVIHGDNWDRGEVQSALERICRYEISLMQGAPYESYTFLLHIGKAAGGGGGGMEHANSTAIAVSSGKYLAGVAAHEFFHLWNVKRIRPASLEPVDYTKEQYTRALWFAEGVTSTYGAYTLLRSGIWNKEQFYAELGLRITELESRPANRWQSAEQSSLDAWLEKYPLYNGGDSSVSYYTKGQMLGVLLDVLIRDRTDNAASLDDVLRALNTEFAKKGRTYRDSLDIRLAAERVAGGSFEEFFRRYVSGAEPLPYAAVLGLAGLEVREQQSSRAALGFAVEGDAAGQLRVSGPLSERAAVAGLREGDVILQWNGGEAPRKIARWLGERKPGERLRLRLRREEAGGESREIALEFPLEEHAEAEWQVGEVRAHTEKAGRIREGLLRGVTQVRAAAPAP
ncbi:MAG: hypothetical protein LAN84_05650 [Acidobacteriia bacterium]|nr:hypothetical protein [Terriglobia bacterium]